MPFPDIEVNVEALAQFTTNALGHVRFDAQNLLTKPQSWAEIDYRTITNPSVAGGIKWRAQRDGVGHGYPCRRFDAHGRCLRLKCTDRAAFCMGDGLLSLVQPGTAESGRRNQHEDRGALYRRRLRLALANGHSGGRRPLPGAVRSIDDVSTTGEHRGREESRAGSCRGALGGRPYSAIHPAGDGRTRLERRSGAAPGGRISCPLCRRGTGPGARCRVVSDIQFVLYALNAVVISTLPAREQLHVDGVRHGVVAGVVRMQMIAAMQRRENLHRTLRILGERVKVDDPVEAIARAA